MTSSQASKWIRERPCFLKGSRSRIKQTSFGIFFRPTTAQLRRILHHPATPKGVRNQVYQWLLYRRHVRA